METMTTRAAPALEDPHATLERALIEQFLGDLGHTLDSVDTLPPEQRRAVLRFATTYATLRLSEMEARARYVHEIETRP